MRDFLGFVAFIGVLALLVVALFGSIFVLAGETTYRVECIMPEYNGVVYRSNLTTGNSPRFIEVESGKVVLLPVDRCVFVEVE